MNSNVQKLTMSMAALLIGVTACKTPATRQTATKETAKAGTHKAKAEAITNEVPLPALGGIPRTLDVAAVRQLVECEVQEFVQAYNAHDAKTIAAGWSPNGTYKDKDGTVHKGRAAIEKLYQDAFAKNPEAKVSVSVEGVKRNNAFTVVEYGTTTVTAKPGAASTTERYVATHVLQSNGWVMVSVEDLSDSTMEKYAVVKDLEWLVGTWRSSTGSFSTEMTITRVSDGPFFQRTWISRDDTNVLVQGVQVIGWDPALKQVASWTFDSRGNTDKSLWSPEENGWSLECKGMLVDGTPFSAKYLMLRTGDDTFTMHSMNRVVGDIDIPDSPERTLKRVAR